MKLMIASDLHGSAAYTRRLLELYRDTGCQRLVLLGDLLYHGPRNPLPEGYEPPAVAKLLNDMADELLCVRGNCDAEVDQMVLHFPILSDSALLVLDGSRPLTAEDEDAIATAAAVPRQLVIVNKTDLPAGVELSALVQRFGQLYPLSAATGEGVDALCRAVEALYPAGKQAQGELLTNARQADAVARSLEAVRSARRALEDGMTPDVVLTDAEAALEALGELNGKRIREDLVQTIFSRFCVGK